MKIHQKEKETFALRDKRRERDKELMQKSFFFLPIFFKLLKGKKDVLCTQHL